MSRFHAVTVAAAVLVVAALLLSKGAVRWWLLGVVGLTYILVLGLGVAFIRLGLFLNAVCRGPGGHNRVALTFDDGPDPAATPALLDTLRERGVHATFFCVGEKVAAEPDLARRIVAEGHGIGNHTFRHGWSTNFLAGGRLRRQIERAQEAVVRVAGVTPTFFRPPMGLTNPHLRRVLKRERLTCVGFDVRTLDRGGQPADDVVRRALRRARDGSILLLHDGGAEADRLTAIVSDLVDGLRRRGYNPVRLDTLLASGKPLDDL